MSKFGKLRWFCIVLLFLSYFSYGATVLTGDRDNPGVLMQWHKITLTFDGPTASEGGTPNPFMDYRLTVTFTGPAGQVYAIPGYFACDGNAANTSASSGSKWRAHLAADQAGAWTYAVSFRSGSNIAVSDVPSEGVSAGFMDGESGSFTVLPTNKTGRDMRAKGRLEWVGGHILQFKGNGEYFLKAGPDSPENLLAYADFDGDFKTDGKKDSNVKTWSAHVGDWQTGDPVWQNTKGKALIGAVNYLASEGLNAFSFLTNNIDGDDQNVFMYTSYTERYRMDVSRMDQWEIVFEHADKKGMFLHFKTFETENDTLLDNGDTGPQRKLYYRELMSRFGHHLAMNWNLGEENAMSSPNQTTAQRRAMSIYWWDHDPYKHHQVIHNPIDPDDMLGSLSRLTGVSRQVGGADFGGVYSDVVEWVGKSANAGRKWAVANDESGGASDGVRPVGDIGNSWVDGRKQSLWGVLMAGGWGNEYYFGYNHAHSDLTCQDFRSRDGFWDYCRIALSFFNCHRQDTFRKPVPVQNMAASNSRISNKTGSATWWCLSGMDSENKWAIVVYAQGSGGAQINVPAGALYNVGWMNAVTGQGQFQANIVNHPGGNISVTNPFTDDAALLIYDWAAVEDTTPPTPSPMTWSVVPAATSPTSITMTATTASDTINGVEYHFDETSGSPGGTDSVWQSSPTYTDTGLTGGQTYTYTVKARDTSSNLNETGVSIAQSATTPLPEFDAPTPNPAQWLVPPAAVNYYAITMTAVTGTDLQSPPVEYYFDETTGKTGATDSGWQSSPTYTDTGLSPGTEYFYTVKMRDQQNNETAVSIAQSATTPLPETDAPTPNPAQWLVQPAAVNNYTITMTAVTGTDIQSPPVEYYFDEMTGKTGATDSGWQSSPTYTDAGLSPGTEYCYTVKMRDQLHNETASSPQQCATTTGTPGEQPVPVHHWKLDETSGTTVADSISSKNGIRNAGTQIVQGKVGSALWFDGADAAAGGEVAVDNFSTAALQSMTLAFWVKPDLNTLPTAGIIKRLIGGADNFEVIIQGSTNKVANNLYIAGGTYPIAVGLLVDDVTPAWTHVAMTTQVSGTTVTAKIYLNGLLDTPAANYTYTAWAGGTLKFAMRTGAGTNGHFKGALDDIRIYNTVLTDAEIKFIYDSATGPVDTDPPTPDPAQIQDASSTDTSVTITAVEGTDASLPVQYYFDETSGNFGANDSGWQTSRTYTDEGLVPGTQYVYAVKMRDAAGNGTEISTSLAVTTTGDADMDAPTPNPAAFSVLPASSGQAAVAMTAQTGSDVSGPVQYYFDETSGNPGGSDSGWQTNPVYIDGDLEPGTLYTYTVTMKDSLDNQTAASAPASAYTHDKPDINDDGFIDLSDLAIMASKWALMDCLNANLCGGADINASGTVDTADLDIVAQNWLAYLGPKQEPFSGTPRLIPGRIELENFDLGGQDVAYSDLTATNTGNATYRPTDAVDISTTVDTGGGYNVGWNQNGEWLEYTVDAAAGLYDISLRAVTPNGGTVKVSLGGVHLADIVVPITGADWKTWTTVTVSGVTLSQAGTQVLRLDMVGAAGFLFDLNWIEFTRSVAP